LSFCLAYVGFVLIDAKGLIKCESFSDRFKVASGFVFIGLAVIIVQIALNILDFGKVYLESLI